eukprot:1331802-Amorphochlora_amoeboformis.AAC.1
MPLIISHKHLLVNSAAHEITQTTCLSITPLMRSHKHLLVNNATHDITQTLACQELAQDITQTVVSKASDDMTTQTYTCTVVKIWCLIRDGFLWDFRGGGGWRYASKRRDQ